MKSEILELMRDKGGEGISFAEFGGIDGFTGDYCWGHAEYNVRYWCGLSREAADAFAELLSEGLIELRPTSVLVYAIDGQILNMPIAKGMKRYKKPRWLPLVMNLTDAGGKVPS